MKSHSIEQNGYELLFVAVPTTGSTTIIERDGTKHVHVIGKSKVFISRALPQGDWQLLGLHTELTEEMLEGIMERSDTGFYRAYKFENMFVWNTAIESIDSLMRYLECYTVNPYGDESGLKDLSGKIIDLGKFNQWQQAQQQTSANWCVCFRTI